MRAAWMVALAGSAWLAATSTASAQDAPAGEAAPPVGAPATDTPQSGEPSAPTAPSPGEPTAPPAPGETEPAATEPKIEPEPKTGGEPKIEPAPEIEPAEPESEPASRAATTDSPTLPPAPEARTSVRQRVIVMLRQDVAWIAGDDPCTAASQANGDFSCFRNTGSQYLGTPDPSRGLAFEGFESATTRLLGGYERFFGEHLALTGIFGVVIQGGGPTPVGADAHAFLPIHLEVDGAYWPWGATAKAGQVRPFAVVGGGVAQIDASFTVTQHEDPDAAPAASQLDNPARQELEVYSKRGTGFIDAGLGAEARISGPLTARGRVLGLWSFPRAGTNLAFDLGFGVDL